MISGGHYDVDCYVEDPNGKTIYQETKKQYDSFSHHTDVKGVYTFCFSNEFSTFSHKIVYFDFQVGDEPPILPDMNNRVTALTQVGPGRRGGRKGGRKGGLVGWQLGTCPPPPRLDAEVPTASQRPQHTPHPLLGPGGCAGPGLPCVPQPSPTNRRELHHIPWCEPLSWASRCPGGLSALSQWGTTLDGVWQGTYNTPVLLSSVLAQPWAPSAVPWQKQPDALVIFPSWNLPVSPSTRC